MTDEHIERIARRLRDIGFDFLVVATPFDSKLHITWYEFVAREIAPLVEAAEDVLTVLMVNNECDCLNRLHAALAPWIGEEK